MEFDNVILKDNPGLCRCCLSEGCYKELGTEYIWMGENEVYADMLFECFDISISQHNDGPNGTNRLICEVCITRLRDACNFKKQVLECEKKFVDMIGRGDFKQKVILIEEQNLKSELNAEDPTDDTTAIEFLDEAMDYDDDKDHATEDITAEPLPIKAKRGRPKKTAAKPIKKAKEEKPKTSKTISKGQHVSDHKNSQKKSKGDDKKAIRNNIIQVLLNSDIMPFIWLKTCFRCFYCYEMFDLSEELKIHQAIHTADDINKTISNYYEETVLVDITNINCKLCPEVIDNLHQLIHHLVTKHMIIFDENVGLCLVPFKLNGYQCVVCQMRFLSHASVVSHMTTNHSNFSKLYCVTCDTRFNSSKDICSHIKGDVGNTAFCMDCNERISEKSLTEHMKCVHNKRYRCSACWEHFKTNYQRSLHMASIHKRKDLVKCLQCPRSFIFESILRRHVKQRHLKEKNVICHICGYKTFGQHELKAHLVKHAKTKEYKCTSCEKMFKTKKNMRQHCVKSHKLNY